MSTRRFLLAAAFAAMAFTFFACSSDEPGGDGNSSSSGATQGISNLPDSPKQIYFTEYEHEVLELEKYEGNSDIFMRLKYDEDKYEVLLTGKIQNGQVSLNLPASIDSKHLNRVEWESLGGDCQVDDSGIPENLLIYGDASLYAVIPGKSNCKIRLYQVKSGKISGANEGKFFYFSESGKIIGTCTHPDDRTTSYNWNFSKGWNLVYENDDHSLTTDLPKDGVLLWGLRCE